MAEYARTHEDTDTPYVGLKLMEEIQQYNPDSAYHGLTVRPHETRKILFRWKLDDGRYQVIFGDLHFNSVTIQRLRELEEPVERGNSATAATDPEP